MTLCCGGLFPLECAAARRRLAEAQERGTEMRLGGFGMLVRVRPTDYRRPRPAFDHAPYGYCRLCGGEIARRDGTRNLRRNWHQLCADWWNLSTQPRIARRVFLKLDGGRCVDCGDLPLHPWPCGPACTHCLEVDHEVPLIDGGSWEFSNQRPRCHRCHAAKTAREARARREARTRMVG